MVIDKEEYLRILRNCLDLLPKTYAKRNSNWVIVQDLIMQGTNRAGRTSSIVKCYELGINPYGKDLEPLSEVIV